MVVGGCVIEGGVVNAVSLHKGGKSDEVVDQEDIIGFHDLGSPCQSLLEAWTRMQGEIRLQW